MNRKVGRSTLLVAGSTPRVRLFGRLRDDAGERSTLSILVCRLDADVVV